MARSRPTNLIEPFSGLDVSGFVPRADLGMAERRAVLGIFPRRSLWPDLDVLNEEIAEQTQHLTAAQARTSSLLTECALAPERDADRLAEWQLAGSRGPRPEPTVVALDAQIAEAQLDADAAQRAVDIKLEERGAFVEKHRGRLVAVAAQQVTAAGDRMLELVDELEHARATLIELRSSEVWAHTYPPTIPSGESPTAHIAGGRAAPITSTLGLNPAPQLQASAVLELLRLDADALKTAATPAQRAVLEGRNPNHPRNSAVWSDTDEGRQKAAEDRQAARQAFEREWGRPAPF